MGLVTNLNLKIKSWIPFIPTNTMKWRMAILLCLTALVFVTIYFLPTMSPISRVMSPRRPRTNITFENRELCALTVERTQNQRTVVIVVLSARHHFIERKLVRQTYGSIKGAHNVAVLAVIFMLGRQQDDTTTDVNRLEAEQNQFGDIVVGDFEDSYRNLTLKTIMAYEWITSFCREAQFVVKTDDDVLVNIFELTKVLDALSPAEVVSSNIWGTVHGGEDTIKDVGSRFYVPPGEFLGGKFPTHCAGVGYVTTMGVIDRIVDEISKSFLGYVCTHEDVFMTGVVPIQANSIRNNFRQQSEPIELVDKHDQWINFYFENGGGDQDHFLENVLRLDDTENVEKFRKGYDNKLFFLFTPSSALEVNYLRLWRIIEKTFSY